MITHLIDPQWDDRHNRSTELRVSNAKFRYKAALENIVYDHCRNIDRNQVMRLADCNFIHKYENLLLMRSLTELFMEHPNRIRRGIHD